MAGGRCLLMPCRLGRQTNDLVDRHSAVGVVVRGGVVTAVGDEMCPVTDGASAEGLLVCLLLGDEERKEVDLGGAERR